jgi:hypothetical protein
MNYRGKKKSSYGHPAKRGRVAFRTNKKTREKYPLTQSSGNNAPKLIKPSNKKLDVAPKNMQNEQDNLNEEKTSCVEKCEKKTKWKVDLLRKDPTVTKKEEIKREITPVPEEIEEKEKTSLGVNIGNQFINVGSSIAKEHERRMKLPTKEMDRV